ncbi:TPA: hypothetical protein ACKQDY_000919 [Serratia marcescens]|nr:hypothetical protein [Serratia marcescens]
MEMKIIIEQIQDMSIRVLNASKKKEGACLYMGALLFAQIIDNLQVRPRFVTGSLIVDNNIIFSHTPIKKVLRSGSDFSGVWDGHAWVEVDGYIFDPSVFWTIYTPNTPLELQRIFEKTFNGRHHFLIGSRTLLEEKGVFYKDYEELSDSDATTFINSGYKTGFFHQR